MKKRVSIFTAAASLYLAMAFTPAHAALSNIVLAFSAQPAFDGFVEEIGMVTAYNPVAPAEPYGITGFDVGMALTMYSIDATTWADAMPSAPSTLPVPRLMARKGLPFGVDVAGSYISVPGTNMTLMGGEVRYAILDGSMATPAVSVSGNMGKLSGVSGLDVSTFGLDLAVSKGFLMLTPYAGVGNVWISGSESAGLGLADHSATKLRSYVGARFSMGIFNFVGQVDQGDTTSYSLRANIGF